MTRNQKTILFILGVIALGMCVFPFLIIPTIDFSALPTSVPTVPPSPTIPSPPTPLKFESVMAQIKCERFIKATLRAPSTAKFSGAKTYSVDGEPLNYHAVTGYVEAQNAFGVPLRSWYRCYVHYIPARSHEWVLDNLEID